MTINWVTAGIAAVLLGSAWAGYRRGAAVQLGHLVRQAQNLVIIVVCLWAGWRLAAALGDWVRTANLGAWPPAVRALAQAWRQSPQTGGAVAFLALYAVLAACLQRVLRQVPGSLVNRTVPRFGRARLLGLALGAAGGAVRAVLYGALLFLALQYFTLPAIGREAGASRPYQWLAQRVYSPFVRPFVARELPVLAEGALQPLANNINLFVVPSPTGQAQGVVVVPKDIADLARRITAGQTTARGKARALYEWEIHHITYDWKKYDDFVYRGRWDQQSPEQTLRTGRGVCADYALLYANLAHASGLTVRIDEGIGDSGGAAGSHAWNEVWDGEANRWIPLDTTWGSAQDAWFDPAGFWNTHHLQTAILIKGEER
ncbi:transglutaminase domain-containing protein [Alicyclobacillus sp.]|uniref:transglutaminase domain-containing protein n=1 Tax=Alicyclobacillus sp. TaxID=61169 RepID=UPI0025BA1523|nr:transglutaminase domain-containing protein [Alicyclobacillus sp.]MCL6515980.1 transglutaminase domain-containing protein [Alicyclobacillus sp.]